MILGAQWYILFNVIAGASAFPNDLKEAAASLQAARLEMVAQVMLPGRFPYYVTGTRHGHAAVPGMPASSPKSRAGATPP